MDKKVVKVKIEEKKLKKDLKEEAKAIKVKPEAKTLKFEDIISGVGVKSSIFFKKHLEIKSEESRTAFHNSLDKEIQNLPNVNGNHMKKVITTFNLLIESDYDVSNKPYKDRDDRYNNFKIIYYACEQITNYWAVRTASGDKTAYKKVLSWKKDSYLIKNVWVHLNSRASKESKTKFVVAFKKAIRNTVKRLK